MKHKKVAEVALDKITPAKLVPIPSYVVAVNVEALNKVVLVQPHGPYYEVTGRHGDDLRGFRIGADGNRKPEKPPAYVYPDGVVGISSACILIPPNLTTHDQRISWMKLMGFYPDEES